jgi:KDO2-lipid IV(A) lauroyltransferase
VTGCWQNLGQLAAEIANLPSLTKEKFFSIVDMKGIEHVQDSYAKGKGLLMICGHYGPWEFYLQSFALSGIPIEIVARRIKNPYVDALVTHYRTIHGTQIILSKNAARNTLRALKEGKMVGILIDHNVREGGLRIPFLGRMANTTSLPAILALRLGVPVHFIRGWREGEKIKSEILPAMNFAGVPNNPEGIEKVTQMMCKVFEDWIREKPENWFWIHNRWKN